MTRYDVSNTAVIAATPSEIIGAIREEAAGRSQWWHPYLRMRQHGGRLLPEIGATVDIAVAGEGGLNQQWSTRLTGRVAAFEPDQRLVLEYFAGDFRGTEEWTVVPVDPGHTRVTTRWRTDPQGVVRLAARFVDVPGSYSKVMHAGFRAIERYTASKRTQSPA